MSKQEVSHEPVVLVVGGAGYVGSHVVKALHAQGLTLVVLDDLSSGHRQALPPELPLLVGSMGDRLLLEKIFKTYRIAGLMHLGGLTQVAESMADPQRYYNINVKQSQVLLAAAKAAAVPWIVFSSTASVYGAPDYLPMDEQHPLRPSNPYGDSKRQVESLLQNYADSYGLRYVTLRYFNAAGADPDGVLGEDRKDESHLIPLLCQFALGYRQQFTVCGTTWPTNDGTCVRDYVHVWDIAQAHVVAMHYLMGGGVSECFNVGSGSGNSVLEVIRCLERVSGQPLRYVTGEARPGDVATLVASCQKIHRCLGFTPLHSELESMVRSAWRWHREHPNGYGDDR